MSFITRNRTPLVPVALVAAIHVVGIQIFAAIF